MQKDDVISRREALEALGEEPLVWTDSEGEIAERNQWRRDVAAIKALPSAQPERKRGRWIDYTEDGYVECPFCHSATNCDGNKDELHFCFSCGADMRGENEQDRIFR